MEIESLRTSMGIKKKEPKQNKSWFFIPFRFLWIVDRKFSGKIIIFSDNKITIDLFCLQWKALHISFVEQIVFVFEITKSSTGYIERKAGALN